MNSCIRRNNSFTTIMSHQYLNVLSNPKYILEASKYKVVTFTSYIICTVTSLKYYVHTVKFNKNLCYHTKDKCTVNVITYFTKKIKYVTTHIQCHASIVTTLIMLTLSLNIIFKHKITT